MADAKKVSPAVLAANFAAVTRQHKQMLPTEQTTVDAAQMQFTIPKARLLGDIKLLVQYSYDATDVDATANTALYAAGEMYKVLRRISLDLNNGFAPFILSGSQLALLNMIRNDAGLLVPSASVGCLHEYSLDTTSNIITGQFLLDMPLTLNEQSTVGLILAQNNATNITLTVDVAPDSDLGMAGADINYVKVTPMVVSYSVPADTANAMPDLSVVKLVHGITHSVAAGQNIIKLSPGTIYRKILFKLYDSSGALTLDEITSPFEVIFNQADIPYSVHPRVLRYENMMAYGAKLPDGVYCLDFGTIIGANPNFAGSRDYIDTENLTEFWLRFTAGAAGNCDVVSETLARLK